MDRVSETVRSRIMASVGTRNTGPELAVRSLVHRLGFRYSLARDDLPGRPDLAFVRLRKVIFVHGCFWHGHRCKLGRLPKTRISYWGPKIAANKARDARQARRLKREHWGVLTVWQCQLKSEARFAERIKDFLDDY